MLNEFKLPIFMSALICCAYEKVDAIRFRSPAEWALQVLRNPVIDPNRNAYEVEPGFDLNEEEMIKFHIWPFGIIPYYIDELSFDKVLRDTIRLYLENVNKVTGLHFTEIPRPPEDENSRWVFFINRKGQLGCSDLPFNSFTNEGVQRVVLGYDCLAAGKLGEVILSLVGVPPQHRAPDRVFVEVIEENILPDKLYLFDKLKDDEWLFYDLKYDYYSAGHYGSHQYTSNGGETIIYEPYIKKWRDLVEGSGIGFTSTDLAKIHMLYNYITRQRDTSMKVPGCDKLFAPGSNFSNFQPNISLRIEPRKKPNRYLLLPEEKSDRDGNENEYQNKTEYQYSFEDNDNSTLNTTNTNEFKEDNIQIDGNKLPREKSIKLLAHTLSNKETILKESDYETGDEGNKKYLYEKSK